MFFNFNKNQTRCDMCTSPYMSEGIACNSCVDGSNYYKASAKELDEYDESMRQWKNTLSAGCILTPNEVRQIIGLPDVDDSQNVERLAPMTNCPNCGAVLESDGTCEYCGTHVDISKEVTVYDTAEYRRAHQELVEKINQLFGRNR